MREQGALAGCVSKGQASSCNAPSLPGLRELPRTWARFPSRALASPPWPKPGTLSYNDAAPGNCPYIASLGALGSLRDEQWTSPDSLGAPLGSGTQGKLNSDSYPGGLHSVTILRPLRRLEGGGQWRWEMTGTGRKELLEWRWGRALESTQMWILLFTVRTHCPRGSRAVPRHCLSLFDGAPLRLYRRIAASSLLAHNWGLGAKHLTYLVPELLPLHYSCP